MMHGLTNFKFVKSSYRVGLMKQLNVTNFFL